MSTHTPGPWTLRGTPTRIHVCDEAGAVIVWLQRQRGAGERARLILTAPDGLALAEDIVNEASPLNAADPEGPVVVPMAVYVAACALIAKALP